MSVERQVADWNRVKGIIADQVRRTTLNGATPTEVAGAVLHALMLAEFGIMPLHSPDQGQITVPADALRALLRVYETWWHQATTVDAGEDVEYSLLSHDDEDAMALACGQVEPYEGLLRKLAGAPPPN